MRLDTPDGKHDGGKMPPAGSPGRAEEARTLALTALAWALDDQRRAERLLALTGLDGDALRGGIANPATLPVTLDAVLAFLADHEPDLIACAMAIGTDPATLIAARKELRL